MGRVAFSKPCDKSYTAVHNSGKRPLKDITLWVVHVGEAPSALDIAKYFTSKDSGGSAHLAIGNQQCFRCLANDVIPWGAVGANTNGVHAEHAGYAAWDRHKWITDNSNLLSRSAYKCAAHCKNLRIRPVFITAADMIAGTHNGITTHHQVNLYAITKHIPGDHTHTCPGLGFPLQHKDDYYMQLVHKHYAKL